MNQYFYKLESKTEIIHLVPGHILLLIIRKVKLGQPFCTLKQ